MRGHTGICALVLVSLGCARGGAARDGGTRPDAPPHDLPATHVCYGAAESAVEVPLSTPCEALGASARRPAGAPSPPRARRTRDAHDAATLF